MATVKMPGLKLFARKLKNIEKNVSDTKRLHGEVVVLYEQWVKRNFDVEGSNHDNRSLKWKPLSEVTVALRRGQSRRILQDTGQLKQRWSRTFNEKQAVLKSAQNYSKIHEHGGQIKFGNQPVDIPQRKIFPEKKQGIKIIRPAVERYLKRAFKK